MSTLNVRSAVLFLGGPGPTLDRRALAARAMGATEFERDHSIGETFADHALQICVFILGPATEAAQETSLARCLRHGSLIAVQGAADLPEFQATPVHVLQARDLGRGPCPGLGALHGHAASTGHASRSVSALGVRSLGLGSGLRQSQRQP